MRACLPHSDDVLGGIFAELDNATKLDGDIPTVACTGAARVSSVSEVPFCLRWRPRVAGGVSWVVRHHAPEVSSMALLPLD